MSSAQGLLSPFFQRVACKDLELSTVGLLYQQQQYLVQADLSQVLEQVH